MQDLKTPAPDFQSLLGMSPQQRFPRCARVPFATSAGVPSAGSLSNATGSEDWQLGPTPPPWPFNMPPVDDVRGGRPR